MKNLNETQQEAVCHSGSPLLVIAGAGSGKTRIVTARIIHLLENGVQPDQILGLTFTNKASGEMVERVRKKTSCNVLISTFHSLGARILRESIHHLGFSRGFTIYDEEDSMKLLKGSVETVNMPQKKGTIKSLRYLISEHKNELLSPGDIDPNNFQGSSLRDFPSIYATYQARLKESNAVDFDDLLYLPVQIFQNYPEILEVYQSRWKYFLIDEYQDTNHAQYQLVKLLVGERKNIFAVGDPDQSIYSWRGASIRNILHFEKDFSGAKVIRLEQNYRSRSNILEAANCLISHNENRYEKQLWSNRGKGDQIALFEAASERDEVDFVTHEIKKLKASGISYDDIVVFYRTNFQSRVFEDYFIHHRIPYVIVGGISFYQRKEVKDILAILRMIESGSDFVAFVRTINMPKRGIGPTTIEKIREAAMLEQKPILSYCKDLVEGTSLKHKVRLNKKQKEGLKQYIQTISELRMAAPHISIRDLIIDAIDAFQYRDLLREEPETFDERLENVQELASKATEWELTLNQPSLAEFLSEISLKSSLDHAEGNCGTLKLMTLHNGKGLEFDFVFIVGLEEDLLPHINSKESSEELEEERRLAYVGITRAKEKVFFTRAKFRYMWGMLRQMDRSRFLNEIPEEYLLKVKLR